MVWCNVMCYTIPFSVFVSVSVLQLPICVQCRTGGARMQEGTSSLMQMAKVSAHEGRKEEGGRRRRELTTFLLLCPLIGLCGCGGAQAGPAALRGRAV